MICRERNRAMNSRKRNWLKNSEIQRAFAVGVGSQFPVILSPTQFAKLLQRSPKTIYHWIAAGRLDGAFRKRGKHLLIWRDRALAILFNGPDWSKSDG
jgi:hypothetical protein